LELTPKKAPEEGVNEEPLAAETSAGSDTCIFLGMQSVEQSAVDKVVRPNHRRR